jgi:hypothetical protein
MYDSDSHVMETLNWLSDQASPEQRGLIGPLVTEKGGAGVRKAIDQAEARRGGASGMGALLPRQLRDAVPAAGLKEPAGSARPAGPSVR